MLDRIIKEENSCIKVENNLIRNNLHRMTNILNGHRLVDSDEIGKDLQSLLNVLEKQRNIISLLEKSLDSTQCEYENLLEKSLQDARIYSNKPNSFNFIAESILKEEEIVISLEKDLRLKLNQSAKEISNIKSNNIHQNAEIVNSNFLPSKSPTLHKTGARVNENKKNKYLMPLN